MASEGSFLNSFFGQHVLTIPHEPGTGYALGETQRKESSPTAETAWPSCAVTHVRPAVETEDPMGAGRRGTPDPDSGEGRGGGTMSGGIA